MATDPKPNRNAVWIAAVGAVVTITTVLVTSYRASTTADKIHVLVNSNFTAQADRIERLEATIRELAKAATERSK